MKSGKNMKVVIMTELVRLCAKSEVQEGKLSTHDVEGVKLMATKLDGKYLVASRICTHKTFDLSNGIYADGYITCTLHTSTFELETGEALNPPATESLDVYAVVEKGDDLYIEI